MNTEWSLFLGFNTGKAFCFLRKAFRRGGAFWGPWLRETFLWS